MVSLIDHLHLSSDSQTDMSPFYWLIITPILQNEWKPSIEKPLQKSLFHIENWTLNISSFLSLGFSGLLSVQMIPPHFSLFPPPTDDQSNRTGATPDVRQCANSMPIHYTQLLYSKYEYSTKVEPTHNILYFHAFDIPAEGMRTFIF